MKKKYNNVEEWAAVSANKQAVVTHFSNRYADVSVDEVLHPMNAVMLWGTCVSQQGENFEEIEVGIKLFMRKSAPFTTEDVINSIERALAVNLD